MKKDKSNVCPGCGKRCPECALRCKYGRSYFAKKNEAEPDFSRSPAARPDKKLRKWEKRVIPEGLAWKLIATSCRAKKALLKEEMTEDQLLAPLTEAEKQSLGELLDKLRRRGAPA